jgi:hypothetical protein
MTAQTTTATAARSPRRIFLLHLGEMLVAMALGMVVLGGALEGVLRLLGTSLTGAPAAVSAAVMTIDMTLPMAWWMHQRGHPVRHNVEMAASMVVPSAIVVALHWFGLIGSGAVLALQHQLMIPAMVGVMLWRYDHYSH